MLHAPSPARSWWPPAGRGILPARLQLPQPLTLNPKPYTLVQDCNTHLACAQVQNLGRSKALPVLELSSRGLSCHHGPHNACLPCHPRNSLM